MERHTIRFSTYDASLKKEIESYAQKKNLSFSPAVCNLIKKGLTTSLDMDVYGSDVQSIVREAVRQEQHNLIRSVSFEVEACKESARQVGEMSLSAVMAALAASDEVQDEDVAIFKTAGLLMAMGWNKSEAIKHARTLNTEEDWLEED